jgi:uncharacterized protein (TIGR01777 family)
MRVFVTGGSGLVGSRVVARLLDRGDSVTVLTRTPDRMRAKVDPRVELVTGDPCKPGPWREAIATADGVVHLAGENLFARRWSPEQKTRIRESRSEGTRLVAEAVAAAARRPVLVTASAVGYYGPHEDDAKLDETAAPGDDFLAQVCKEWESAADPARRAGARVVALRTGVVLDPSGGALANMLPPFRFFVGGPAGSGRQWLSWIHGDDLAKLYLFALDDSRAQGPVNATAPEPVTMKEFARAIGRALGRPSWAPVPGFALRLLLGEVASVILTGQRVVPRKSLELGFSFGHSSIDEALAHLLARPQTGAPRPRAA